MDAATAENKTPAVDPLDSPAVAAHKAKKAAAKLKAKATKKGGKKATKKAGKKAAPKKAKGKSKAVKASKAAKRTVKKAAKRKAKKAAKPSESKRAHSLADIKAALRSPKTVIELAKFLKVTKTSGQNYIIALRKAGVKLEKGKARQGKRGPKADTFKVVG